MAALSHAGAVPPSAGLVGQRKAAEGGHVGRLEVEAAELRPVDATKGGADASRVGEGVPDGQAHVGQRQLRDGAAVGELGHRVDNALRVHHDLDAVVGGAEQFVRLDHFQPLVQSVLESMVIFGPIFHVG